MKKQLWLFGVLAVLLSAVATQAQQISAAFGVGTVLAPSAASASGNYSSQSLRGGAYPAFSGDFLIHKNFGVMGEIAWKGSQGVYAGYQPYRPIFWDFNGVYAPPLGRHAAAELSAGIGAESTR